VIAVVACALAGGHLPDTAHTLTAGEAVVRLPTGRSAVGLSDQVELWIVPLDLGIGGPRLGMELGTSRSEFHLSVRPSVGLKHTLRRTSARVDGALSWTRGVHTLSATAGLDARFVHPTLLLPEGSTRQHAFDRLQAVAVVAWDVEGRFRARLRLPLRDRGHTLRYGSGSVGWVHTTGGLHVLLGAGLLVGRPVDQVTLGTYAWWFWQPYPEVDVALRF
jgi:hypothetical protein